MDIQVQCVCPCGAFVERTLTNVLPDLSEAHLRVDEEWGLIVCDACTKDLDVHLWMRDSVVEVEVEGVIDLHWSPQRDDESPDATWDIAWMDQLSIYKGVVTDVVALLRSDYPKSAAFTMHCILNARLDTSVLAPTSTIRQGPPPGGPFSFRGRQRRVGHRSKLPSRSTLGGESMNTKFRVALVVACAAVANPLHAAPPGTALGTEFAVSTAPIGTWIADPYPHVNPRLHHAQPFDGGDFLVAWGTRTAEPAVLLRRFSRSAQALGAPIQVNTTPAGPIEAVRVATGKGGTAAVVWTEAASLETVYLRRIDAAGAPLGQTIALQPAVAGADNRMTLLQVAISSVGTIGVAWEYNDNIWLAIVLPTGQVLGPPTNVSVLIWAVEDDAGYREVYHATMLQSDRAGGFLVGAGGIAFVGRGLLPRDFFQRYSALGAPAGLPVVHAWPCVAPLKLGGIVQGEYDSMQRYNAASLAVGAPIPLDGPGCSSLFSDATPLLTMIGIGGADMFDLNGRTIARVPLPAMVNPVFASGLAGDLLHIYEKVDANGNRSLFGQRYAGPGGGS